LSHSRKGYSEVLWRQTTEEFIRGLENAFWVLRGGGQTDCRQLARRGQPL
jgi:hypothetical protein